MATINCDGALIDLSTPHVMGIVNCTPDSFYDGGALSSDAALLHQVGTMLQDGATFIDVGGYSSRPDGSPVSVEEECRRVLPAIETIRREYGSIVVSCDSFRESVITKALNHGANLVNDISAGLLDAAMLTTVARHQVPYIMMHMRGTPHTMAMLTDYEDMVREVIFYFSERIAAARAHGINDVLIDPGFGFAKTVSQNFQLLNNLNLLQSLDVPILAGLSRKSMIYKTLQCTAQEALNGTTALHMIALQQGARVLRVHDVKEAMECVTLFKALHT